MMNKIYYQEMLKKGRLVPFFNDTDLIGIISFYITNNPDKYIFRVNSWSIEEDDPDIGKICYIDQYWTNRKSCKYSIEIKKRFINYIKLNFRLIQTIRWNRWKNDKLYKFNINIKKEQ